MPIKVPPNLKSCSDANIWTELDEDGDEPVTLEELGIFTLGRAREYLKSRPWSWIVEDMFPARTVNLVSAESKAGKALEVDTPILTSTGWSTMGELQPGMFVHTVDGSLTEIVAATEVQYDRPCFRVTTRSGCSVVADARHEWLARSQRRPKIVETAELGGTSGSARWKIPVTDSLQRLKADLPLDPWLLGYWLGNGSRMNGCISVNENDLTETLTQLRRTGFTNGEPYVKKGCSTFTVHGLVTVLKSLNLIDNKHIPPAYLLGSEKQRRALLEGLLDSDGHFVTRENGSGTVEFTSVKKHLAEDTLFLMRSLGIKAKIVEGRATLNGQDCGPKYRIHFAASRGNPFCRFRRRIDALPERELASRSKTDAIESLVPVESVPVRCIQVAHPSGLFLAGKGLMVTHNSCLVRSLLHSVATGRQFLNRSVVPGPVLYYSLEDPMDFMVWLADKSDMLDDAPIHIVESFGDSTLELQSNLAHFEMAVRMIRPILVVIDMFIYFTPSVDVNNYGAVSEHFMSLLELIKREFPDVCVVLTHHNHKTRDGESGTNGQSRVLGSVAFNGRVFTTLIMDVNWRNEVRYVATTQRRGKNLPRTRIRLDPKTELIDLDKGPEDEQEITTGADALQNKMNLMHKTVVQMIKDGHSAPTADEVCTFANVERSNYNDGIREAVHTGLLIRHGKGKKGDPYTFTVGPLVQNGKLPQPHTKPVNPNQGKALKALRARKNRQAQEQELA